MQINVLEYLEQGALANFKDRPAIVHDGHACAFEQLAWLAKRCASQLVRKSDATNRPIAVYLPKSSDTVVADLGILYSGNCYMNLDLGSPPQRIKSILGNVDPLFVITAKPHLHALTALDVPPDRILLIDEIHAEDGPVEDGELKRRRDAAIDTDPVCIINTSGSTGVPKSVVMHHRSIIDFLDWVLDRFDFDEHDVIGSLSPFYFDIYTLELYVALARGATISIIPETRAAFPAKLVQFLTDQRVSFIFWVPSIMVTIANMGLLDNADWSSLKKVFFAGEVFPTKQFNIWRRHLPNAMFVNLYGPIEITVDCTYYVVDREFADDEPLPIGVPCRNTDMLILNEQNQPAKMNETGELCVRGSSLALGYWNHPEKTNRAFVQNPLNTTYPELIYRTGDLAYRNERNEIMFVGRRDYQIKHLGYRIELGEIENAAASIGLIDGACVLYHKDRKEITLFFTAKEDVSPGLIRRALSDRLPKYMLPTVFHQLPTMPRNPNGKVDRQRLTEAFFTAK
jgi:amino acid adenylation domain-containing protein